MDTMTEHDEIDPYRLYSRREASEFLRCSEKWLDTLTGQGKIYSIRSGRRRLFPRAALTAYVRGETFGDGYDGETWPPTPSMFDRGGQA